MGKRQRRKARQKRKVRLDSRQRSSIQAGKPTPTISACMMVKNEEQFLPRCLKSINDHVDEIIVVDTGSTDRTVQIAQDFDAKVYHHPWENDFSKHRNQSIYHATGDWIFILDGDEEVVQWDRNLNGIIQSRQIDSVLLRVENVYGKGQGESWHNSIRLFRNNGKIHYIGRVHNQLIGYAHSLDSSIIIYHRGYDLDAVKEAEKYLRTTTLLEQEIQQHPDNPKFHHYLAVAHLGRQHYEAALAECTAALSLAANRDPSDDLYLWTRFVAAVSCLNTKRHHEAEALALEAIKINPKHLDSHYILSSIYFSQAKLQLFMHHSDSYLALLRSLGTDPAQFGLIIHNTVKHEWRIRLHRAFALTLQGQSNMAKKEYSRSLKLCLDKGDYYKHRCLFHLKHSEYDRAEQFLRQALKYNPQDAELHNAKFELLEKTQNEKLTNANLSTPSRSEDPTISLCMIVKNEERFLSHCLDSVKDHVDEIIVVDTGSTDRTVEIAKQYTNKIYFHPWEDNFSTHRNQSISYASKEWILILDADEVLAPKNGVLLREAIKNKAIDSVHITVKSAFDQSQGEAVHNSIRLFRNNGVIRYQGRVHNRLVGEQASKLYPIHILHEGYNLPPEQSRQKFIRTTALLNQDIAENPQNPWAFHHLAAAYLSEGMYADAISYATKAIELADKNKDDDYIYLWTHFIAGISQLKTNQVDEAEQICLKALSQNSSHLDSHYLLTIIYSQKGRWNQLLHHSEAYLALLKKIQSHPAEFGTMVHNTVNHQWRVRLNRGYALNELHRWEESKREFSLAQDLCESEGEYHSQLALLHTTHSQFSAAEPHLIEALKHKPEAQELHQLGAVIYEKLGVTQKEKHFLEGRIQTGLADIESLFRLGTLYLKEKCYDKAAKLLTEVLENDENHTGALINLGIIARKSGDIDGALGNFEKVLQRAPNSVVALSNLGYVYYDKDDLLRAIETFERLLGINPTLIDIHLMLAMTYLRLGHVEPIVAECDQILDLLGLNRNLTLDSLSDLSNLFIDIGNALLAPENGALSALAYEVAIHLSDEAAETAKKIGKTLLQRDHFHPALQYLEKAVRLNPRDWDNFSLMGDCYLKMGLEDAATMCHHKAGELNPGPTPT